MDLPFGVQRRPARGRRQRQSPQAGTGRRHDIEAPLGPEGPQERDPLAVRRPDRIDVAGTGREPAQTRPVQVHAEDPGAEARERDPLPVGRERRLGRRLAARRDLLQTRAVRLDADQLDRARARRSGARRTRSSAARARRPDAAWPATTADRERAETTQPGSTHGERSIARSNTTTSATSRRRSRRAARAPPTAIAIPASTPFSAATTPDRERGGAGGGDGDSSQAGRHQPSVAIRSSRSSKKRVGVDLDPDVRVRRPVGPAPAVDDRAAAVQLRLQLDLDVEVLACGRSRAGTSARARPRRGSGRRPSRRCAGGTA